MVDEGYIKRTDVMDTKPARSIQVTLKYGPEGQDVVNNIKRISTPGCRVYKSSDELKPVIGGYGIAVVSTSKGVFSDRVCRAQKIGGEVICEIR